LTCFSSGYDPAPHGLGRDHLRGVGQQEVVTPRVRLDRPHHRVDSGTSIVQYRRALFIEDAETGHFVPGEIIS